MIEVTFSELGQRRFGILVHGGAGTVAPERRERHVEGCLLAAREGRRVLIEGGTALDATERAVRALEDDPVFNAGTGACLDADGHPVLDASIMCGETLRAGAVCALARFANPIAIARAALHDGRHVLYAAEGARAFALEHGFHEVDEASLITDASRAALEAARRSGSSIGWAGGTVGAVAVDAKGHVAAATSTGGMVNKHRGRVGDSPLIGAGTYADDHGGAVSTTGHGEGMIRLVVAKAISDLIETGALPGVATRTVIARLLERLSLTGGAIAASPDGRFAFARSTATMSWALASDAGEESGV